jgi:hypothetical protein
VTLVPRPLRRLLVPVAVVLAAAPAAHAAARPGAVFSLRAAGNPKLGYFVYRLQQGTSRSGAIIVSNTGTRTGAVKLYAADAATGATTGAVYLAGRRPVRAGTWVRLARRRATLAPGRYLRVPFTVRVPRDAKPGQWVAGLVAETARIERGPSTHQKARVRIRIRNLTIVAVQVDVPGRPRPAFAIGAAHVGGRRGFEQLFLRVANTGNMLRKPRGRVVVAHSPGAPVETLPFKMDTFVPSTSIPFPLLLKKALSPGHYVARVTLSFANGRGRTTTIHAAPEFTISGKQTKQVFGSASPTAPGSPGGGGGTTWAMPAAIGGGVVIVTLLGVIGYLIRRPPTRGT